MEDIERAINIIERGDSYNDNGLVFSQAYFVTNEDIDKYISKLNIKDKNVLTVAGSGDHIFYSALYGAKSIDAFDMNKMTYYIYELRKAAIIGLSIEEYLNYYPTNISSIDNFKNFFDIKLYNKFRNNLSKEAQYFWDYIYDYYYLYTNGKFGITISYLCVYPYIQTYNDSCFYSKEKYELLKEKLCDINVNYYHSNTDLPQVIKKRKGYYDSVILSNIFDWLSEDDNILAQDFFYDNIDCLLKDNSISMVYYDIYNSQYFKSMDSIKIDDKKRAYIYKKKFSK